MCKRKYKHLTVDDLLKSGSSEKFTVQEVKGKLRVIKKQEIVSLEMYLNETELKKAGIEFLRSLPRCMILFTDNMALRVGNGRKAKTRNPGMSDHTICLNGYFVAIEAKMPGKDLDDKQVIHKNKVLAGNGIFIVYHSVSELISEMKKYRLINRGFKQ